MADFKEHEVLENIAELKKYLFDKTIGNRFDQKIKNLENRIVKNPNLFKKIKNKRINNEIISLVDYKKEWLKKILKYNECFFIDFYDEILCSYSLFLISDMARELRSCNLRKEEAIFLLKSIKSFEKKDYFNLEETLSLLRSDDKTRWEKFYTENISKNLSLFENYKSEINRYFNKEELTNPMFIGALLIFLERQYDQRLKKFNSDIIMLDQIIIKEVNGD